MTEQKSAGGQCAAAHVEDSRPCVGPVDAVKIVDKAGGETPGCVLHGAVLLASLVGGRVYPGERTFTGAGDVPAGAATAVYNLARELPPFAWRGTIAPERAAELLAQESGPRGRLCAHADSDGEGMHWLEPGERCPQDTYEPSPIRDNGPYESAAQALTQFDAVLFGLPEQLRGRAAHEGVLREALVLAGTQYSAWEGKALGELASMIPAEFVQMIAGFVVRSRVEFSRADLGRLLWPLIESYAEQRAAMVLAAKGVGTADVGKARRLREDMAELIGAPTLAPGAGDDEE